MKELLIIEYGSVAAFDLAFNTASSNLMMTHSELSVHFQEYLV